MAFEILDHPRLLIQLIDVQVARFALEGCTLALRLHVCLPFLPAHLLTMSGGLLLLFLKNAPVDCDTATFLFVIGPIGQFNDACLTVTFFALHSHVAQNVLVDPVHPRLLNALTAVRARLLLLETQIQTRLVEYLIALVAGHSSLHVNHLVADRADEIFSHRPVLLDHVIKVNLVLQPTRRQFSFHLLVDLMDEVARCRHLVLLHEGALRVHLGLSSNWVV